MRRLTNTPFSGLSDAELSKLQDVLDADPGPVSTGQEEGDNSDDEFYTASSGEDVDKNALPELVTRSSQEGQRIYRSRRRAHRKADARRAEYAHSRLPAPVREIMVQRVINYVDEIRGRGWHGLRLHPTAPQVPQVTEAISKYLEVTEAEVKAAMQRTGLLLPETGILGGGRKRRKSKRKSRKKSRKIKSRKKKSRKRNSSR
jgi:hypothetical protein